jgi:hypothetical protein
MRDKLNTSQVLGKLIENYARSASTSHRDCRLIVPGLTREIAREIHENLLECLPPIGVRSYLVVGNDQHPLESEAENRKLISPIGLTSERIGSFVAIVNPEQLVHIQDSIRGSGGPIRSLAFSEEWPWIDNGNESFRFNGPFLETLISGWSCDDNEKKWLREFILNGLLEHTLQSSYRSQILLEDIIGNFCPDSYPEIDDIRYKLLYHAGIPRPSGEISDVKKLISSTTKLCQKIVKHCQNEEEFRLLARDRISEVIPPNEQDNVRHSLDTFLDGLRDQLTSELGILAFHGCWGCDPSNWIRLTAGRLEDLFEVGNIESSIIEINNIQCPRMLTFGDFKKRKIATFFGEILQLDINYKVPLSQFGANSWKIKVLHRQRNIVDISLTENEGQTQLEIGTDSITNKYARKIPLRVVLVSDNEPPSAEAKLEMSICGSERKAFVVVMPNFEVIDATLISDVDNPDRNITLKDPADIFLFTNDSLVPSIFNEDETALEVIDSGMASIWKARDRIDPSVGLSGQIILLCRFGDLRSVISFEAMNLDKGEFTIEDELRVMISGTREKRLKELLAIFEGNSKTPYTALGQINETTRVRCHLAEIVSSRTGWKPLLVNLLGRDFDISSSSGRFINCLGTINDSPFTMLDLPEGVLSLLRNYSEAREAILQEVESSLDSLRTTTEHPLYASHPIFVAEHSEQIESLLVRYLETYNNILSYIEANHRDLERAQLFVLAHLDCVVHWDRTPLRNAFFLVGPWHPLVLGKRFMVQKALFSRAQLLSEPEGKAFRYLSSLFSRVQGFRWVLSLSYEGKEIEHAFVSTTSDPGWHIAIKVSTPSVAIQNEIGGMPGISRVLKSNFGLSTDSEMGWSQNLTVTALSNFFRAFPSHRSIGVRIRNGYSTLDVIKNVDTFLHQEESPTDEGIQLPGGVRLYFEEKIDGDIEAKWSDPPLSVYCYKYDADDECIRYGNPDIYMLPPSEEAPFRNSEERYVLPRGIGHNSVFSKPLNWITEGGDFIPKSITYEFDSPCNQEEGVGGAFKGVLGKLAEILGSPYTMVTSVKLGHHLNTSWVIIPGRSIDPAVLVKFVRDGAERSDAQERVLWDYKLDITGHANSFFILSTVPSRFRVVVNGCFGSEDIAGRFIVDLGKIGIAIGGEALKSGRHAMGIIGLIGAARLLTGKTSNGRVPLSPGPECVGFLIPVDSFSTFFGKSGSEVGKRTDLLAIQLFIPTSNSGNVRISACGVESKFISGTFTGLRAHAALEQGKATVQEFKKLVNLSLIEGAMPEKMALLELVQFGLRITSPNRPRDIEQWVETERMIYQSILSGKYDYLDARQAAILVSTEKFLPGVAELMTLDEGLWIRLTPSHWPEVAETPQVEEIRQILCNVFDVPTDLVQQREVIQSVTSSPGIDAENVGESIIPSVQIEPSTISQPSQQQESQVISGEERVEHDPQLEKVLIGVDESRRMVYYDPQSPVDPLDNLNVMVSGSSGTGKTQFLKYLICKFREQNKNVLILDFKNDFASDETFCARARLERVSVNFAGLPYNPLIPYPVRDYSGNLFIQCGQYIAGVSSVLKRTYGLGAQQQASVKNAIADAFTLAGIPTTGSTPFSTNLHFPDFSNVGGSLQRGNISAYNRLDPLFTLGLFREENRGKSFETLVNRSIVLDLSQIQSEDIKNAIAQLVVLSAHSYYNTQPHSGAIRQFLVFDEAHRVLNSDFMLSLVRECRAYGVGAVLSSQYPSDFPGDISSSMATKVVHGNGRDIEKVREIVRLLGCENQESDVANLERFQAFLDNRDYPHTMVRTMNYPLYLVWSKLLELGSATRQELSHTSGIDESRLPIENLVQQLERLGLAQESGGRLSIIRRPE